MSNLFAEARDIIRQKGMVDLTDAERETVGAVMIVVNHPACPYPDDMSVLDALDKLANLIEGEVSHCKK